MNPVSVTTQSPYKLQMWPAHLLAIAASGVAVVSVAYPSATRQYTWPWAPLLAGLWLTPLIATVGRLFFRNSWTRPNLFLSSGLALLAGSTLLSAAISPYAHLSILRVWPTVAGVALYFWLHDWLAESADLTRSRILAKVATGFGAFLASTSLLGWYWNNGGISWTVRNDFPFGHSIYTAGAMVMVLPWLVRAVFKTSGVHRAGWIATTSIGFLALLATSSRGGVLAVGATCVLAVGWGVVRAAWPRRVKVGAVMLAAGILAVGVWSNPRLRELTRGQGWSAASQASNAQRSAMLEAGAKLGAARPLLGWGPGTIPLAYPTIRGRLNGGVDSVLQLHSTPAQVWATLGSSGVLALALLLAAFVRRLAQIAGQTRPRTTTLASAASLVSYGLFALTDHQLDVPAMNALLVVNLALLFFDEPAMKTSEITPANLWCGGLFGGLILAAPLVLSTRDLMARYSYDQSLTLYDDGRPAEGMQFLETAAERAPYDPYYRHQLAGRLLEQRTQSLEPDKQAQLTAAAVSQLEQSLEAGCLQEFAHFNLGWLSLESNRPAVAISHFLAALQDAPHRGGAYFGLGLALRARGDEPAAIRAFALEWINDPVAFTASVWEWPDFAPLRPKIIREADALLAELPANRPTAGYVRDLWRWWESGTPIPTNGFSAEANAFTATVSAVARDQPLPAAATNYSWGPLLGAWRQSPTELAFAALTKNDRPFAAALVRRAARHPAPDIHAFLTAGLEQEPDLLLNTGFSRAGYGVLALHPDGPALTNLYVMQQNRLVATFASTLFPPKGWITARELLSRLPPTPASP